MTSSLSSLFVTCTKVQTASSYSTSARSYEGLPLPFVCLNAGLPLPFVCLNAGLPARSQCASGRSCDRPTRSRFPVVFLGPRVNELVPKIHVALQASRAALPIARSCGLLLPPSLKPSSPLPSAHFCHNVCYTHRISLHVSCSRTFRVFPSHLKTGHDCFLL